MVWDEPLPENAFSLSTDQSATLFIHKATVENTGYYTCVYENREAEADVEPEEEQEAGIYVFVPGELWILSRRRWEHEARLFDFCTIAVLKVMMAGW